MINKVILTGRLVADVELRTTNDGISYTYFTLAVSRGYNKEKTDFISCVAWRGTAELMKKYLSKGSLIGVEGRIEVYSTQENGNYNTRTNVNTTSISFLESKKDSDARNFGSKFSDDSPRDFGGETQQSPNISFEKESNFNTSEVTPSSSREGNTSNNTNNEESEEIDFDSIKF